METLIEGLRWVQAAGFVLVAVWAVDRWRRQRDEQTRWLAATFASLGFVASAGRIFEDPTGPAAIVLSHILIAILLVFPYLLLRFVDSFEPVPSQVRRAVGVVVVALVVATPLVDVVGNSEAASPSTAFNVFTLAVVASWVTTLPYVGVRFWRAGTRQSTLPRRRLQLLSIGVFLLALALALVATADADGGADSLLVQGVALLVVGMLLTGFAPPRWLRRTWRHAEEQALQSAAVGLMLTTTPDEVGQVVVPHLRAVVGARAVAVVHQGEVVGTDGVDHAEVIAAMDGSTRPENVMGTRLTNGEILAWVDRYTPFFGEEEQQLLGRIGLLIDLAMHRTELLSSEREARSALEHINAELESFVYSASHDLKSPLIAILSYVDLLVADHQDRLDEEARWYLDRLVTNGRYMESLIGDLLELSRVGRTMTTPERTVLTDLVADLAGEIRGTHPAAQVVHGDLPVLWANGTRMRQLLQNLVENAVNHGPPDVRVEVTSHSAADGGIELVVRDDGPGIPSQYHERVFGVFERLEVQDKTSGTGIGLAVCRKVVGSLDGRIWLTDREGGGAEFHIHLPATVLAHHATTSEEVPA